ncbi:class I SAM-dependent methyltransferase [Ktedonosporobacter rubrisoli]|uniref:Class I SAM-dependent methyltransferase n=1 Tax=Ktedonosporobacter rubrisoli TaxID=2509675 RepID=A0A4P6JYU7_KTERU|nr:class I SAM-dependent methyltransferase [Ktedonosporobacter rubrisoli]QBD80894.1 class I SAM-dependent methyltransferase [Ktedonosporobacter rubrisoli]
MTPTLRKWLFETLYKNRYLYRFASTVPFAGQWRVWQRLVLPRIQGLDVLELGCGLGDLLADMLKAGYHCRAVEQSPQMVAAARDILQKRKLGLPSLILQGSAQRLPFSSHSFDTVVSTFPSEYIYDPDTIAEVERVLRPGGRLIVIEGANLLPVGFLQSLLVLLQAFVYGPAALFGPRETLGQTPVERYLSSKHKAASGVTTEVVPHARFGRHIPLEDFGLQRRSERVQSRRWEVYITIGEKS